MGMAWVQSRVAGLGDGGARLLRCACACTMTDQPAPRLVAVMCDSPLDACLLWAPCLTCACRRPLPDFSPVGHPVSESPVRGKAQADSRVRARCSGYWRASGCTGRGEASGSRECRARACGAKIVIVIVTLQAD